MCLPEETPPGPWGTFLRRTSPHFLQFSGSGSISSNSKGREHGKGRPSPGSERKDTRSGGVRGSPQISPTASSPQCQPEHPPCAAGKVFETTSSVHASLLCSSTRRRGLSLQGPIGFYVTEKLPKVQRKARFQQRREPLMKSFLP